MPDDLALLPQDVRRAEQYLTMQRGRPQVPGIAMQPSCADEQTEILTQRGWLSHHSLDGGEVVLALAPRTRDICWEPVILVQRFEYDEWLTRW